MSSHQVTTTEGPTLKAIINQTSIKNQIALALPKHLSADRFIRIATTALMRVPNLAVCTQESFMKCLLDLSALGIEPDGRRAHLIPFKNNRANTYECTMIIDWKGLAELAQRSGQIAKLHADLICENDQFAYNLGVIEYHRIDFRKPRGEPYAAYAMAETKDGAVYVAVMTKDEIYSIRDGSQGWSAFQKGFAKQSPWDPRNPVSEGEMWKKTAFRRLSKWLPLSAEFRDAVEKEDHDDMRNVTPGAEEDTPAQRTAKPARSRNPYPTSVDATVVDDAPQADGASDAPDQSGPAPSSPEPRAQEGEPVFFEKLDIQRSPEGASKPWVRYTVSFSGPDGTGRASTFDEGLIKPIEDADAGVAIIIVTEPAPNPKHAPKLVSLSLAPTEASQSPAAPAAGDEAPWDS